MTRTFLKSDPAFSALAILLFFSGWFVGCRESSPVARLQELSGVVQVRRDKSADFQEVREPVPVHEGTEIKTGRDSTAKLVYADGSEISLRPQSFFVVENTRNLGLQTGGNLTYRIKKNPAGVTVKTPMGVTAVLGTEFAMEVTATSTRLFLDEGKIRFSTQTSRQELQPGETMTVNAAGEISTPRPLDSTETEQFSRLRNSRLKQLLDSKKQNSQ